MDFFVSAAHLQAAIENLYAAFSNVPKPEDIDVCPCCMDQKEVEVLLSKPLRALTPRDLSNYASSVFLTVGSEADFLYFLPRILHILAGHKAWWPNPEVVGRALFHANWQEWPEEQSGAVKTFFDAVLDNTLLREDTGWDIDSWLCSFGCSGLDLTPHLQTLEAHPGRLIEFYECVSEPLMKGHLDNFWEQAPEAGQQVVNWFHSDKIKGLIETAYGLR